MPLPTTGPLSFNQIRTELGISQSNSSLRSMSSQAGKSTPDAVSEFRGFSNAAPFNISASMYGYGSLGTTGTQAGNLKWGLLAQHYAYGNIKDNTTTNLALNQTVTINATASHYFNYISLDIWTHNNLIYSSNSYSYSDINTTQNVTFSQSDLSSDPLYPNAIYLQANGYYQYQY